MLETPLNHLDAIDYLDSKSGSYYSAPAVEALKSSLLTAKIGKPIVDHRILTTQLAEGMILGRDLKNHNGDSLLPKGTKLANSAIMILVELERSAQQEFQLFVDIPAELEVSKKLLKSLKC
jgi:hypothetical protein